MKYEIKKILDYLKPKYDIVDELGNDCKKVKFKDCKLLLDYITNLQEENERLKVELENKLTPDELVSMLNQELVRQNKNYKSRNEKAIEYNKKNIKSKALNDILQEGEE